MYEDYYGFRERPFSLSPNPRFLLLLSAHSEALANLRVGLAGGEGITLLVGQAGTGKTTLAKAALASSDVTKSALCVYLTNPTLTREEFYQFLAAGFGLSEAARRSKTTFLLELQGLAAGRRAAGMTTALILDESQGLSRELLEEVRLLTNLDSGLDQLLAVVLIGQPELAERLNDPALRQLKQRIALRCDLKPLRLNETAQYISRRLCIVGGRPEHVFTQEAVWLIHQRSLGIPRTISVICDNALVTGFAHDTRPVGREIIEQVCRDFDLSGTVQTEKPGQLLKEADPKEVRPVSETQPVDDSVTRQAAGWALGWLRRDVARRGL